VVSANTPNCHRYPSKVFRAARQVRRDLLAWDEADGQVFGRSDGQTVGPGTRGAGGDGQEQ
jgi:hypothetical protein